MERKKEKIWCPCTKCGGKRKWAPRTVADHVQKNPPPGSTPRPHMTIPQWEASLAGQSTSQSQVGEKRKQLEAGPEGISHQRARINSPVNMEEIQAEVEVIGPMEEANEHDLMRTPSPSLSYRSPSPDAYPNKPPSIRSATPLEVTPVREISLEPTSPQPAPSSAGILFSASEPEDVTEDGEGLGDGPSHAQLPPDSDEEEEEPTGSGGEPGEPRRVYQDDVDDELDDDDDDPPEVVPLPPLPAHPPPNPIRQTLDSYTEEEIRPSRIDDVKIAQEFVNGIRKATLENGKLPPSVIHRLRNPTSTCPTFDDPLDLMYLRLYDLLHPYPKTVWDGVRNILADFKPEINMPSLWKMKKEVAEMTGIISIEDDMCERNCVAFVDQWADLDECPECGEPRWDPVVLAKTGKKQARKTVTTVPFGPQHQVLRMSKEGAEIMRYRSKKVEEIYERLRDVNANKSHPDAFTYDDIFCGKEYLTLHRKLKLTEDDTVISFSVDGAQLERKKKSACYIGIWIVHDYDPKLRFKKTRLLPAFICPGPDLPRNLDSVVYRSFHHLSALQRENGGKGVKVWDGLKQAVVLSRIIFWTNLADAVALPDMDGRVGHHGAKGCRLGCPMKGRHKSSGFYYAAHACPNNCTVAGSNHPDTDLSSIQLDSPEQYAADLDRVEASSTQADFEKNQKETGLSKRSILSGLVQIYMPPVPRCFTVDLMHLLSLNMSSLIVSLFTGKMKCESTDTIESWSWAVLTGETWVDHGVLVEEAIQRTPSSFRRPPLNPEKKYNSGFKATQHEQYLYLLGPGLFRAVLPHELWVHYCKLVAAVRIFSRRSITRAQIKKAREYAIQFVQDFENKYYQRRFDRLHFCRPVLHTLLHCAQEIERVGPGLLSTQYPMERTINDYTREIRLKSNVYGNLSTIAVKAGRVNALHAICPQLDVPQAFPKGSRPLDKGYVLLRPRTPKAPYLEPGPVRDLVEREFGYKRVQTWGRIRLPNGQVLRSRFSEERLTRRKPRVCRMAKINLNTTLQFGEVLFYFLHPTPHPEIPREKIYHPKVVVSFYSPRQAQIYADSHGTLDARTLPGDDLRIIDVYTLLACVAMQKLPKIAGDPDGLWFVCEKPSLDGTDLMGFEDELDEEE